jgi:oligoribonuclease NrnB/cAMP/cGMP phosphodiesterase (DHH superfamily)
MNKYNYVIFHKGCLDGFSGLIVLSTSNRIENNAIIHPDVPSTDIVPPNVNDKNVIIIDVAYKKQILEKIFMYAKSVVFIDHHITIKNDTLELKKKFSNKKNIEIVYDQKKCGASLTWKYLYDKPIPLFIKYVQDNDTGTWSMKHTRKLIAGLNVKYNMSLSYSNIKEWQKLLFDKKTIMQLIKKGTIYHEYIDYLNDINSKRYTLQLFPSKLIYDKYPNLFTKIGQYKVAVYCGSGCPDVSLLSVKMLDTTKCDFVVMWNYQFDKNKFVLSFRSKKVDVGKIAEIFNGGGHTLASAGSFNKTTYDITDLFLPESLPRNI